MKALEHLIWFVNPASVPLRDTATLDGLNCMDRQALSSQGEGIIGNKSESSSVRLMRA